MSSRRDRDAELWRISFDELPEEIKEQLLKSSSPTPFKIVGRRMLDTYKEPISEVPYQIDNSNKAVETTRGIKVTKSIERQSKVDVEQIAKQSTSGKFTASVPHVSVEVARQVEATCRSLLSESVTKTHSVEDTVSFRVPPRTVCYIKVRWMRIWERGEIILANNREELTVPYHESTGLMFDVDVD